MSESAITLENVSKRYRYGGTAPLSYNLRADITEWIKGSFRSGQKHHATLHEVQEKHLAESPEYFWALKDINLDIKQGEVVGIIGRNGAGKSTLLKILSRITPPTTGMITYHGRVASLLEVGTGFHRELTGRENIFLNGSILGMKRSEIVGKLDEIIAFAEVEKFIDTPVKFYSSGMYVRLAFAVAAHLQPEILIIDEVLAVGDAAFQAKCLGKMGTVAKEGRTVLFVSHNMAAILKLCPRSLLLDKGTQIIDTDSQTAVAAYLRLVHQISSSPLTSRSDRKGNQRLKFTNYQLTDKSGQVLISAQSGQDVVMAFDYESKGNSPLQNVHIAIGVHDIYDDNLFHLSTSVGGSDFSTLPPKGRILCRLPRLPLQPGRYTYNLYSSIGGEIADWIQNVGLINVEAGDFYGSGKLPPPQQGSFLVDHSWDVTANLASSISRS
jgi:lipopolysaccharide transport system ATP-binding protein